MLILILSCYNFPSSISEPRGPWPTPFCYLHQSPVVPLVSSQVDFPISCAPFSILSPGHTLSLAHPPIWLTSLLLFHQWDMSSNLSLPRPIHQINNLDWGFCLLNSHHTLPLDYHWTAVIDYLHLGLHITHSYVDGGSRWVPLSMKKKIILWQLRQICVQSGGVN